MEFDYFTIEKKGIFSRKFIINKNNEEYLLASPTGFFSSSYKICTENGYEIVSVIREFAMFTFKFNIHAGEASGTIKKETFSNTYVIQSNIGEYLVKGNIWSSNFTIYHEGVEIAKCTTSAMSISKRYNLAIERGPDEDFILGIMIALIQIKRLRSSS